MAKQTVVITTSVRTRSRPASISGTSIKSSSHSKGNPNRCPTCGKFMGSKHGAKTSGRRK